MSKRIVFISDHHISKNIGGAEVQTDLLAKYLSFAYHEVIYLSKDINSRVRYNGYDVLPLPDRENKIQLLLKELDADVYYQRGRKKLTGTIARFCMKNNKKFIFSLSMDIDCYKFKYFMRGKRNRDLFELFRFSKKSIRDIVTDIYSLWGMRQADIVISQTKFQKKLLKKNLGIESKLLYNLHPKPADVATKTNVEIPIVLWLANIKAWKQPEIFLKMARDLSEERIYFLMAGYLRNKEYQSLIEDTERQSERFQYLGGKTLEESNQLIKSADIFVNTSKEQEGFPNTFIQAWLRGVPVVSLNFDPDDIIKNYELGNVASNYSNLLDQVQFLATNSKKRLALGQNAINYSNKYFSIEKNIHEFITIINEL